MRRICNHCGLFFNAKPNQAECDQCRGYMGFKWYCWGGVIVLILAIVLFLTGCAYSRPITTIKHADGSGETTYRYIGVGGIVRPGMGVIVCEVKGSNSPMVLMNASGPPIAPSITGAAGNVASAAVLGGLWPQDSINTTTVIQDEPRAGPIPPPNPPVHPPNGRPPSNRPPRHK